LVSTARYTFATLGTALLRVLGPLAIPVMLPLDAVFALLLVLGQRDGQRAEYLADQIAVDVAGSDAVMHMLDFLLVSNGLVATLMAVRGRPARPDAWRAAGEQTRRVAGDLTVLGQRSLRTGASLLATHPPVGRRARMVRGRPDQPPTVTMSDAEAQRIDAELTSCYERLRARAAEAAYT
jgi:Zn-dependent protease with chaperone function